VLAGGIVAWLVFMIARLSDILVEAGFTSEELWGPDSVIAVRPSTYLIFAAIAVFTLGGLLGRRHAARAGAMQPVSALTRPIVRFASTVVIIGLVLAAIAAIEVFMSNFFSGADDDTGIERLFNSYLPIILYTALVVSVILVGFVFSRPVAPRTVPARPASLQVQQEGIPLDVPVGASSEPGHPDQALDTGPAPGAEPAPETGTPDERSAQRATALAYTLPIVAVAVALIFGLIVYDVTQTALETWVWVIVQALVAAGIIAGTVFAARAYRSLNIVGERPTGSSVGAKNLNLVLSIIFAAVVASMSLGYGSSAVELLRVQPSLWLSANVNGPVDSDTALPPSDVLISLSGSGLLRGSEAVATLGADGDTVLSGDVDHQGNLWAEGPFSTGIPAGSYELTARAVAVDGVETSVSFEVSVTNDGLIELPDFAYVSSEQESSRVVAPGAGWIFGDFAPAAILLLLVVGTLAVTLRTRNPDTE